MDKEKHDALVAFTGDIKRELDRMVPHLDRLEKILKGSAPDPCRDSGALHKHI